MFPGRGPSKNWYTAGLEEARISLQSFVKEIEDFWKNSEEEKEESVLVDKSSFAQQALNRICDRFHKVALQLKKRYSKRQAFEVQDEYDVQDLLHALMRLYFDDIRTEEWTPSYAGGANRADFLLKDSDIVVETKMTRSGLTEHKLGDELLIDAAHYKEHPDCHHLVCFIYDPEHMLTNPAGLTRDLENYEGLSIRVFIRP